MVTRELLDKKLPDGPTLRQLAETLTGLDLSNDLLGKGLRWLAELTERCRHGGLDEQHQTVWPIEASGLHYKTRSQYLTAQGWPSGAPCWFVRIDNGITAFAGGETPELALLRGLVLCGLAERAQGLPDKSDRYLPRLVERLPALPAPGPGGR